MACAPFAIVCYLNLYDQVQALGGALAIGATLSSMTWSITRGRGMYEVPTLNFGTRCGSVKYLRR